MPDAWRRHLVTFLAALVLLSGILGLAQVTGGSGGPLRLYAITNKDAAVGLFANRNHQALLLVMGLPIMAIWSRMVQFDKRYEAAPKWIALGVAIFLIPLILVTGSRGGLLLLGVAVPAALLLLRGKRTVGHEERIYSRFDGLFKWLPLVAIVIVLTLAVILARTTALDRLTATTLAEEQRNQIFPYLVEAATSFFPFGSGFGSFDSVYRAFEPVVLLNQSYMNQAHNDVLQLIIEGGLPGVILLLAGLWWYGKRAIAHWRGTGVVSTTQLLGRLGSVLVALILLSSFVDYPLRTPIMAVILAIAMLWMAQNPNRRQAT
jgi:O-antigen ligase